MVAGFAGRSEPYGIGLRGNPIEVRQRTRAHAIDPIRNEGEHLKCLKRTV